MSLLYQSEIPTIASYERDGLFFFAEGSAEARGEVFTKPAVAEFILDLVGWRVGENLIEKRLLEPSCGAGDFLLPAIERLLDDTLGASVDDIARCIRGIEINRVTFDNASKAVRVLLHSRGLASADVDYLLGQWLCHVDFLTKSFEYSFTHVVGNPPYLRLEALPRELMQLYRSRFRTMYDRSDLYIPFFEKGLNHLDAGGCLGYICSDRWMKNRYGGPLRAFVEESYHLETYVDFTGCAVFQSDVVTYPAVTVIRAGKGSITRIIQRPPVDYNTLGDLAQMVVSGISDSRIQEVVGVASGSAPWLLANFERLSIIQMLEADFPTLLESGCKVGIGVATGLDKVFIGSNEALDVEGSRKLRLVTRRDLKTSGIEWTGKFVLNPFDGNSAKLVNQ